MPAFAQNGAQPPAPTPAPTATPGTQNPVSSAPAPPPPLRAAVPDYPEPRSFTVGLFYWITGPGNEPGLITGRGATDNETLADLGKPKRTPGVQISIPISRTGELKLEGFIAKGDGNQTAVNNPFLLGTTQFNTGDLLASQYQITNFKLYLDDLLYPHKFPVAKFRLKSLWEVQYVHIKSTIDAPLILTGETATGTKQLILPTFGLVAEYQFTPHVLFRAGGSGFGLYHRSDIWDGEAILSWRGEHLEIFGGAKAFHFKMNPNQIEYFIGTLAGGVAGVRWHF